MLIVRAADGIAEMADEMVGVPRLIEGVSRSADAEHAKSNNIPPTGCMWVREWSRGEPIEKVACPDLTCPSLPVM